MLRRYWRTWVAFAVAACALLGVVGALSWSVVTSRHTAAREEAIRLALWRMDAAVLPIIARESERPVRDFEPPATAYRSPLSTVAPEHTNLYFQLAPDGELSTPQGFAGDERARRLGAFRSQVGEEAVLAAVPDANEAVLDDTIATDNYAVEGALQQKNSAEWSSRQSSFDKVSNKGRVYDVYDGVPALPVTAAALAPVWVGDELLLVRRVDATRVQGVWLDWPGLRAELLAEIQDLLPGAVLRPASDEDPLDRRLATLPVVMEPGALAPSHAPESIAPVLAVAWGAAGLGAAAVLALLIGQIALSERRASFVTAVTHELRTPLTTLRTYTEMLADERVRDEAKRRKYLGTMQRESLRLGHLIENVLSYSQIERGKRGLDSAELDVHELLDRAAPRLADRAAEADMTLDLDVVAEPRCRGDATAVEQILFNLVDNACKYARGADDARIEIRADRAGDRVRVRVTDFGPGIPADERRRVFAPFHKSAQKAAVSAPGVGLGLALCRRLARQMRGELRLDEARDRTTFELTLPAA